MLPIVRAEKPDRNFSGIDNTAFRRFLKNHTSKVRAPYGVVQQQKHNGKMRQIGDPPSALYEERKKAGYDKTTRSLVSKAAANRRYEQSENGRAGSVLRNLKQREARKELCAAHQIDGGTLGVTVTAEQVAQELMHMNHEVLGNTNLVNYASTGKGGVYVFTTGSQTDVGVKVEAMRFITDGQKGRGVRQHNAVLMRNPNMVKFDDNICPYGDRFKHGFKAISYVECGGLGLGFIILLDQVFSSRQDCCKVEQACQYLIDDMSLGAQRLHRIPGAGMSHSIGDGGRMIVGATFLPENFFEDNPDIVIVGSKRVRNYCAVQEEGNEGNAGGEDCAVQEEDGEDESGSGSEDSEKQDEDVVLVDAPRGSPVQKSNMAGMDSLATATIAPPSTSVKSTPYAEAEIADSSLESCAIDAQICLSHHTDNEESSVNGTQDTYASSQMGVEKENSRVASAANEWACSACTLHNKKSLRKCGVCGTKKPPQQTKKRSIAEVSHNTTE